MNNTKDNVSALRRQCTVEGCAGKHLSNGVCRKHYERLRRHGGLANGPRSPKLRELLKWVEHTGDDCLVLPLAQGANGYVDMYYEGQHTTAHRVMCRLTHGEPPTPDLHAAHSCGRGRDGCLNPEHLYWATRLQNAADSVAHGAQLRGADAPRAVLTEAAIRAIRAFPRTRGYQSRLAEQYGVARQTITAVIANRIWKHVA